MTTDHDPDLIARLYRSVYGIRRFEESCVQLYRQGHMRGYLHPYLGEEAIAAGVCAALGEDDYIVSTHRGHGHCLARGAQFDRMFAEIMGKATGYCGGLGGSMHIADPATGNLGANGIVGAGIPIGAGAALGATIRGEARVSVVFSSDGAANHGTFGEALNLAAIWNLPVLLVIENNQYAVSTPIEKASRVTELHKRGDGYGVEGEIVDGNDVVAVYEAAVNARDRLLRGEGPYLLEALTFRHAGHHVNDPGDYMPADRLAQYKEHDPVIVCRKRLPDDVATQIENEVEADIDAGLTFAHDSPEPEVESFLQEYET